MEDINNASLERQKGLHFTHIVIKFVESELVGLAIKVTRTLLPWSWLKTSNLNQTESSTVQEWWGWFEQKSELFLLFVIELESY